LTLPAASSVENEFNNQVGFCVGTGRCGTTFLTELIGKEPTVAAAHERDRLGATFHMFCKWHHLEVDPAGFLLAKEEAIRHDLKDHAFSFESSALLSHSLQELFARFQAKFLLLVRHPADTVASFAVRGWFLRTPVRHDTKLPPTFYGGEKARHFLGRNIPYGDEFDRWANLTQIGRLAWFWQARNRAILQQFQSIPTSHCQVVRLEDLDFERYQQVATFLGWRPQVTPSELNTLTNARLNAGPNAPRTIDTWSQQELAEFQAEVGPIAKALGYAEPLQPLPSLEKVLSQIDPAEDS